jgi:hypothetical protein
VNPGVSACVGMNLNVPSPNLDPESDYREIVRGTKSLEANAGVLRRRRLLLLVWVM